MAFNAAAKVCWTMKHWPRDPTRAKSFPARAACASWAGPPKAHGKRGGARVIYFWWLADDKILLLDIYAKGEQEDLSADEIARLKQKIVP